MHIAMLSTNIACLIFLLIQPLRTIFFLLAFFNCTFSHLCLIFSYICKALTVDSPDQKIKSLDFYILIRQ